MNDPFEVLGVPRRFRLDISALEQQHRNLSRALHPDRFAQAPPGERRLAIEKAAAVNDAFRRVRNSQTRAAALLALVGRDVKEESRADAALLEEVLELREQLESARPLAGDARSRLVGQLRDAVSTQVNAAEEVISQTFDAVDGAPSADALDRAYEAVVRLRYLCRFLEEADALLEE